MLARRRAWFKGQPDLDPERLVFIDETGASTKMARLRGRSKRGTRCRSPIPHGHWKTTTFTGASRMTGLTAPMVLDGPMTGEWFAAYAQQVLAPTLRPGDIVILDNLPAHKVAAAREAIEAVGARMLFLPPYSPDFNPIEKAFSRLKAMLRKAGERIVRSLWHLIGRLVDIFQPDEYANYFSSCGYDPDLSKNAQALASERASTDVVGPLRRACSSRRRLDHERFRIERPGSAKAAMLLRARPWPR